MTTAKLICPECRHENEPERIYCHECGTRLDRTNLKIDRSKDEAPKDTQRRLRRMLGPRWSPLQKTFFKLGKVVLAACAAAAVAQMLIPPAVPPRTKTLVLASQITMDLEAAMSQRTGGQLRYSEEDVNGYFLSALKTKQKDLDKPLLHFERAVATFDEGVCRLTVERSVYGFSVFATSQYGSQVVDGKATFFNRGGRVGRLNFHPELMKHCDFLFADVFKALERERKNVSDFANVEFQPKAVVLTAPSP